MLLQNDVNTQGHTQWYFFRVQNTKKGTPVKFNILNLCKPDSLYNDGMKVLIHSERKEQEQDVGWFRGGFNICYFSNNIKRVSFSLFKHSQ